MADYEPEQVTSAGLAASVRNAAPTGDTVPADCTLRVTNGGAAPITLTVVTPGVVDGDLAVADREVSVAAGASKYVRVTRTYRTPSTGRCALQWSDTTSVTFEVIRP